MQDCLGRWGLVWGGAGGKGGRYLAGVCCVGVLVGGKGREGGIRTGLVDVGAAGEEQVDDAVAVLDAGGDHEGGPAAVILRWGGGGRQGV